MEKSSSKSNFSGLLSQPLWTILPIYLILWSGDQTLLVRQSADSLCWLEYLSRVVGIIVLGYLSRKFELNNFKIPLIHSIYLNIEYHNSIFGIIHCSVEVQNIIFWLWQVLALVGVFLFCWGPYASLSLAGRLTYIFSKSAKSKNLKF